MKYEVIFKNGQRKIYECPDDLINFYRQGFDKGGLIHYKINNIYQFILKIEDISSIILIT